ncbi:hypothetical protein GGI21_003836, partial [Coemansia aciculifera]
MSDDDGFLSCLWEGCGACHFTEAEALYAHITNDHVGRKSAGNLCLECKWEGCTVKRTKRDHITSHIRVHVPLKPHRCTLCAKSFKRPQDLKKHERTHMEGGGGDELGQPGFDYPYYHDAPHTPAYTSLTDGSVSPPGMPYARRKSPYTPLGASPIHGFLPHVGETNYYPPSDGQGKRGIEAIEQFQQTVKKCRTAGTTNQGLDCLALAVGLQENKQQQLLQQPSVPTTNHTNAPSPPSPSNLLLQPLRSVGSEDSLPPPLSAASSWSSEASGPSSPLPLPPCSMYLRQFSSTRSTTGFGTGNPVLKSSSVVSDFGRSFARKSSALDSPHLLRAIGHDALFSFLQQNRDINSIDLLDLPPSLQTASELQQLNEGVMKLLPDLSDLSGRSLLFDQLVQQLDSTSPNSFNDILMLGNLQAGPTADPLLSMTSSGGLYNTSVAAPVGMSSAGQMLGFDLTASPEAP